MSKLNWRSITAAFMALLTALAAVPYTIGELATIIPPAAKPWVFIISATAAFLLRTVNSVKQPPPPPQQREDNKT